MRRSQSLPACNKILKRPNTQQVHRAIHKNIYPVHQEWEYQSKAHHGKCPNRLVWLYCPHLTVTILVFWQVPHFVVEHAPEDLCPGSILVEIEHIVGLRV